jgi:hypothetical protein
MEFNTEMLLRTRGWIGSFGYAVSAIPQVYTSIKQGHSDVLILGLCF